MTLLSVCYYSTNRFYTSYIIFYDEQVYGKGAKKTLPPKDLLFQHIAKKVNCIYALKDECIEKLKESEQLDLLTEIEIPLSKVLGKMEFTGMKIDKEELNKQKSFLEVDIDSLSNKIYELSGEIFNISSPKQLGIVLFEKMGIPYPKKKGNSYYQYYLIPKIIVRSSPMVIIHSDKTKQIVFQLFVTQKCCVFCVANG